MMEELRQKLILNSEHTLQLTSTLNHDDLRKLASLLEVNSSVVSVEISNSKVFDCDKLLAVFERKQNILTYKLRNISEHEAFMRFGELIVRNGSIVHLDFHTWTSKFDLKAIQILSSALTVNKTIQSLQIALNGLCLVGIERLMEAVSFIPSLTKLHYFLNNSTISVAPITRFVSNNDTLTDLCVDSARDDVGMKEMVKVLQNNNGIRSLDLSNSKVKDAGVEIAALLITNSAITDLRIDQIDNWVIGFSWQFIVAKFIHHKNRFELQFNRL
jgi:hypothetical protein